MIMEEALTIVYVRWLNLFLVIGGIIYAHIVSRKLQSFYLGVPLLIWLFQALIFYLFYILYFYRIVIIPLEVAVQVFPYWATFSRTLGLMTTFIYLYYIRHSCWRGNGT